MPEIGPTLRETRMRQRLDITEVEAATKIRAKYLRALENEEWDQLPGPTFVRTFLRTYGDYLGLDSRMLVEEYKQRFQRPTPQELLPFSPRAAGRRQRRGRSIPRDAFRGAAAARARAGEGQGRSQAHAAGDARARRPEHPADRAGQRLPRGG